MSYEELRDRLEQAGRRPVPAPRKEFVDSLLARIELGDEIDLPRPVPLAARRATRRLRLTAVVGMAAAMLAVVGVLATLRSPGQDTIDQGGVRAELAGDSQSLPAGVSDDGAFIPQDGSNLPDDGVYRAICTRGGRIPAAERAYFCTTNQRILVEVADGKIVSVQPQDGDAAESTPERFELTYSQDGDSVTVNWEATAQDDATNYVVLRSAATGAQPEPVDPAYPGDTVTELSLDETSFNEVFEDVLPTGTPAVAYRVAVVDGGGTVLAMSGKVTVTLSWTSTSTAGR